MSGFGKGAVGFDGRRRAGQDDVFGADIARAQVDAGDAFLAVFAFKGEQLVAAVEHVAPMLFEGDFLVGFALGDQFQNPALLGRELLETAGGAMPSPILIV